MTSPKISAAGGADWTQLLADPDVAGHLAELLKVYREAAPEKREQALVAAMQRIKGTPSAAAAAAGQSAGSESTTSRTSPTPPEASPPFEPDIFTPSWGQDRRRYPRMKCFVAVELHVANSPTPIWGNLSNTSIGGCFVETATPVPTGVKVEIGLWVANGKLWVKGLILNGVVTQSSPCFGVRVRFADLETTEREVLRQFLRFVENTTKGYSTEHGYVAQMKR